MVCKALPIIAIPAILFGIGIGGWQSLDGPPAGRADDMSIGWDDANQNMVIYVADWTGWLYRSYGRGWDSIFTHSKVTHPVCVITPSNNGREVLIARHDYRFMVMKSEDGGYTWLVSDAGIKNYFPRCFAIHPEKNQIIFLGCQGDKDGLADEVYRSEDGGYYWYVSSLGLPADITIRELTIIATSTEGTKILAATSNGVYYSFDGGANWTLSNLTGRTNAVAYGSEFIAYAGGGDGLYRSTDGGRTWAEVGDFTYVKDVAVANIDEVYVVARGSQIRKIIDGERR